jgi:hypothetical protein
MNKLIAILYLLYFASYMLGCSTTTIKHATIDKATFNSATWKSQAGVAGNATIEATTDGKLDSNVGLK